jgi:hypothetical protein
VNSIRTLKKTLCAAIATVAIAAPSSAQTDPGQVAFSLEREGKLTEAEAAWSALAKQFPTRAEPLAHLGLIESKQEHYAEAITLEFRGFAHECVLTGKLRRHCVERF